MSKILRKKLGTIAKNGPMAIYQGPKAYDNVRVDGIVANSAAQRNSKAIMLEWHGCNVNDSNSSPRRHV